MADLVTVGKKLALGFAAIVVLWFVVLVVIGFAYADRYGAGVADRVGESLGATGTMGSTKLSLVRGRVEMSDLSVQRDDAVGKLSLDVGEVDCDTPPLGIALFDRSCNSLAISHVRMNVSTGAVFQVKKPKRPPIRAHRVTIDDAQLVFERNALVRGIGRIAITVEHAQAGETVFRTPLAWLLSLEELRARFDLPARVSFQIEYRDGTWSATGTLFGKTPVQVAMRPPVASLFEDNRAEVKGLVKFGEDLAEALVARKAENWLQSKGVH